MNIKRWPIRFTEFESGKQAGIVYFEANSPNYFDQIEDQAAKFANDRGVEIDIESGSVMPSGKIGSWERMGLRVRPTIDA